ncbi:hypothetical protein [Sphaerospermopsis aphanizomenoides]|nr:hypothetical protein [Sphaerospermopsis aphanizomenoides]
MIASSPADDPPHRQAPQLIRDDKIIQARIPQVSEEINGKFDE